MIKKITYKDITNKIDINKLSSKIKNVLFNIHKIKSNELINNNKNKPNIYYKEKQKLFIHKDKLIHHTHRK